MHWVQVLANHRIRLWATLFTYRFQLIIRRSWNMDIGWMEVNTVHCFLLVSFFLFHVVVREESDGETSTPFRLARLNYLHIHFRKRAIVHVMYCHTISNIAARTLLLSHCLYPLSVSTIFRPPPPPALL